MGSVIAIKLNPMTRDRRSREAASHGPQGHKKRRRHALLSTEEKVNNGVPNLEI
jgi:hypothetical protein